MNLLPSEAIKIGKEGMEQWWEDFFDNPHDIHACSALGAAYLGWCKVTGEVINPYITYEALIEKLDFGNWPYEKVTTLIRWNKEEKLTFDQIIDKLDKWGI